MISKDFKVGRVSFSLLQASTLVCSLCVLFSLYKEYSSSSSAVEKRRILSGGIRSLGGVSFPLLLFHLLPVEKRGCEAAIPPLAWMMVATLVDEYFLFHAESSEGSSRPASLRLDPSCIAGLTFGICGFLGMRSDNRYSPLFLTAVVTCLSVVLPSHNLKQGSIEEQVLESIQKTVLFSCISLVIAGVSFAKERQEWETGSGGR